MPLAIDTQAIAKLVAIRCRYRCRYRYRYRLWPQKWHSIALQK